MQSRRTFLSSLAALTIAAGAYVYWSRLRKRPAPVVLDAIDALTRRFIHDAGVSAGQLAIIRNGAPIFSKVYADPPPAGYAAVTTQTLFRLASCSKMFTCAAIDALHTSGKLDLNQKVFPLLGIDKPALPSDRPDAHINDITVQHLIDHAGGWNVHEPIQIKRGPFIPSTHFDPTFRMRQVALDLGLAVPPSKLELARYIYGQPLQFAPGTQDYTTTGGNSYSNIGYMLLGLVVEAVSGQSYIDFLRTTLDGGGAWPNVLVSPMLSPEQNPHEVWYVDPAVGLSALEPRSDKELPFAYGGGGFITELMDSAGGLMTNAETLAQFSQRHAAWGMGGRIPDSERNGSMAGTYSAMFSRPNGVDCAFVLNNTRFNDDEGIKNRYVRSLRKLLDQL